MNDTMSTTDPAAGEAAAAADGAEPIVRHFRQIVLWPFQVICEARSNGRHYQALEKMQPKGVWAPVQDEFGEGCDEFQERHYREFVSFLPHVQRFLYGDALGPVRQRGYGEAPLQVYRRNDVARVRISLPGREPVVCDVAHVDLCFFYDLDAAILVFELSANDIPLSLANEILYRFGRAYPPGWSESGAALNCPDLVEWLDAGGTVLARSDFQDRQRYVNFVGKRRAPCIASHWEFLLRPLVANASDEKGALRFRQIEYYRMPAMAYLTVDRLSDLTRPDFARLALGAGPGLQRGAMPYAPGFLERFEEDYCYDRFFAGSGGRPGGIDTRIMTSGHAFVIVAGGNAAALTDNERGLLGQFRHQYYLLFMIAHFHKAALLMMSDRLVAAIKRLDPGRSNTLLPFRREIFRLQESFLRFTQRYYFEEVSDQVHARDLFRMLRRHLGNENLYNEVRSEIVDMVQYLDSNMLRRQSGSMHRLTVVTIVGLIGTIATGFLGMNLLAMADIPVEDKMTWFAAVIAAVTALTAVTMIASRPLTALFDWMSGESRD